ncbi:MAG TPA: cytochrome c3 family protein [Verrucomicrobiae bacterium]|nr:cytochrome c3 family protein [Verrucomicrobiae bacterium]
MIRHLCTLLLMAALCSLPGTAGAQTCSLTACHGVLKGIKVFHKPVGEIKCLDCHRRTGNHPIAGPKQTVTLIATGSDLCFRCHKPFPPGKVVHYPVKEGACISCHRPHGAGSRYLIDTPNGQTSFCTGCHDPKMFSKPVVHPPVAEGKCTACHDPHQENSPSLLKGGGVPKLCLQCHQKVMTLLLQGPVVHPPVRDGKCVACHDPHSTTTRYLLKSPPGTLCVSCHTAIGKKVSAAASQHKPIQQGDSCMACHVGHVSKAKSLLPGEGKDFCLGCHTKLRGYLEGKRSIHGPISQGKCIPCHDPHGSTSPKLLKGKYPEPLYVTYDREKGTYALCFTCHNKNMLSFPDTTIYTKFRNGKQNLHYFHITMRKGRTCRLCHEPHASEGEHLITEKGAEFGEWKVPVRFQSTPTGGSCSPGCHGTYSYDRAQRKNHK